MMAVSFKYIYGLPLLVAIGMEFSDPLIAQGRIELVFAKLTTSATSIKQCGDLREKFDKLYEIARKNHSDCLEKYNALGVQESGGSCSVGLCQPKHTALDLISARKDKDGKSCDDQVIANERINRMSRPR